jgi:hypothetical protein
LAWSRQDQAKDHGWPREGAQPNVGRTTL